MIPATPRLTIELVPRTCWQSNLARLLPARQWARIRREIAEAAGRRCQVCGGAYGRWGVDVDERWAYDDTSSTQRLVGLVALCRPCHEATHIGMAEIKGRYRPARTHLAQINGWDDRTAEEYVDAAFDEWRVRSEERWGLEASIPEHGVLLRLTADEREAQRAA